MNMFTFGRRALLAVYAIIIVVPIAVVVFGSFKTQQGLFANPFLPSLKPQLGNYSQAMVDQGITQALVNSAVVTVPSVVLTLILAILAAYAVARIPGWKGNVIFVFLILGMSVPAQANMIVTLPVATFILGGFMKTLPPSLFEASSIDGAGAWRAFRSIAVPLSAPSIAATTIFLFVIQWNDLLYPLLLIQSPEKKTLPLALIGFQGEFLTNYPLLFTGVIVSSLPIVIAYVFLQRYFVAGITAGAVKG